MKNTVWLSISNFGGRILRATVIIYAARALGPPEWGIFSYAVTLAGFLTFFVDPGINAILIREGSKSKEEKQITFLSTIFYIKMVLLAVCVAFVFLVGPYFSILPGAKILLPIVAAILISDSLREFFSSFIRAREKMEWEAGIFIFTNLCIVVFGFAAILVSPTARSFGWAYAVATGIGALTTIWVLWAYLARLFSGFSLKLVAPILRSAWPFAVTGALGILLTNADILIVSWMRSASDVGIYSAAIRIVQLFYLFPTVVVQYSILPLFSRLAGIDKPGFRRVFESTMSMIFFVSIPIAFAGAILGTEVMRLVFGAGYGAGGLSLKILMATMIFGYPGAVISSALFAHDHQKSLIAASAIAGGANVILDILFIPRFGIAGSALATLIAQVLSSAYLWYVMKQVSYFEVVPRLKKVLMSSAIMAGVSVLLVVMNVNIFVNIALCILIYFVSLKLLSDQTFIEIKKILRSSGK
jgi:O-antigen/teichoic acid export membrane protein